ncbi:hypothetical protein FBY58_1408 [Zymomonas mobilis]|uniref:Uncharacterized protein n=1 Tax=Zymomonas mobilis TaxID=542 RepID=A0A542W2K9_ZYMMB|nr:hypothetical protein FBY58_1408 [Zymomonas mobilis]
MEAFIRQRINAVHVLILVVVSNPFIVHLMPDLRITGRKKDKSIDTNLSKWTGNT